MHYFDFNIFSSICSKEEREKCQIIVFHQKEMTIINKQKNQRKKINDIKHLGYHIRSDSKTNWWKKMNTPVTPTNQRDREQQTLLKSISSNRE